MKDIFRCILCWRSRFTQRYSSTINDGYYSLKIWN